MSKRLKIALAVCLMSSLASAQQIGTRIGPIELEGFTQTGAKSYDDFLCRAVLIEFFANL